MSRNVVYKAYDQDQLSLLPPSYDELIPENHPVRIVNTIVDKLDISSLEKSYKGGGTSSYHPRMLLKVIIYSYLRNLYSSRKIEQALQENWTPTINQLMLLRLL
jgi:transposase